MFKRFLFLFSCIAFLSAGCATFHEKPLLPEKTAAAFEARRLDDAGLKAFIETNLHETLPAWPPASWDLPLSTLVAFYYHPDLDIARAQWAVSQAGEKTAGERPNPSLVWGSELYVTNAQPGISPWIFPFSLDIPVETAGKRGIRQRQAAALSEAARLDIAQAAWEVRRLVRSQFLAFTAAEHSNAILQDQQRAFSDNEHLLTQRSRLGETSPLNAAQAVVLAGRNRLALEDSRRQQASARAQLADALGLPLKALDGVSLSTTSFAALLDPNAPFLSQARRAALLGRADLASLLMRYEASQAVLQLEVAKQYPDVHLGPGLTYDQGADKWGLGLTVPLPILNQNRGPIAEANARREEAAARFIALQDKTINEIDRATEEYRAAYQKLQTADAVLDADRRQDQALRRILRPGDVSRLTFFRSQLDIDSSRLVREDAWRQCEEALGALEDALERPVSTTQSWPPAIFEKSPRN